MKLFNKDRALLLILTFLVLFSIIVASLKIHTLESKNKLLTQTLSKKQQEINNQEDEISNYLSSNPTPKSIGSSTKEPYSFSTLGIASPLFKNKEVTVQKFEYKRNVIIDKSLTVKSPNTTQEVGVSVWKNEGVKKNAPILPPTFLDPGWEWVTPLTIDQLKEQSKEKEFMSKNGIPMILSYFRGPTGSSILGIKLTYLKKYSPFGDSIIVQLHIPVAGYPNQENASSVSQAKTALEEVANTIAER